MTGKGWGWGKGGKEEGEGRERLKEGRVGREGAGKV